MSKWQDGPASSLFTPIEIDGNIDLDALTVDQASSGMLAVTEHAHRGDSVAWGIPFRVR